MLNGFLSIRPLACAVAFGATSIAFAQATGAEYETAVQPMPAFEYSMDDYQRDEFTARADADIERAKGELGALEDHASSASASAVDKIRIEHRLVAVRANVKASEAKLAELKQSPTGRRKSLEKAVTRANRRLQHSIEKVI